MNIALIGPSGVGKGTHARKLVETFDLLHLVTGDLFRKNIEERKAVGLLARRYIDRGELVPDEVVDAMVEEWLWHAPSEKDVLFDGFPRTIYQAQFLDAFLADRKRRLDGVIYLDVSAETIIERLAGRVICRNCQTPYHLTLQPPVEEGVCDVCGSELYRRPDDIPEVINVRLRTFNRVTKPLVDYYHQSQRLIVVDAEQTIPDVEAAVMEAAHRIREQTIPELTSERLAQISALKEKPARTLAEATGGLNIVLFGGPGSGKGTQAEQLKSEFNLRHISTGDLFRENLKKKTELGQLAKSYMDRGELVPDDVTEAMVEERLARPDTEQGFILDGFPRTLAQAEALTEIMRHLKRTLDGVLYIKVSEDEITRRLSGRLICRECQASFHKVFNPFESCPYDKCEGEYLYQRDDDKPETIRNRLKTFHAQTGPLLNYYREAGLLIELDGQGDVSEVIKRTFAAVRGLRV